jgi:hypothetical protein
MQKDYIVSRQHKTRRCPKANPAQPRDAGTGSSWQSAKAAFTMARDQIGA